MEDVFKFLLVAAFIVIGLVRQSKKKSGDNADEDSGMPLPDADMPLPEPWKGSTCEHREDDTSGKDAPPPPSSFPQESDEATPEYGIHSAEEARKAIIWSEILQRKY